MDHPYAEATCVLKVDTSCQACKMKTVEILGSICGIYNIDINAEEGVAKLQAVVDPNVFMKALAGTGSHAKPQWVKLQHPKMNPGYYYDRSHRHGYSYGAHVNPFAYSRPTLPDYHYTAPPMQHYSYPSYNPYYHGSAHSMSRRRGPFQYY